MIREGRTDLKVGVIGCGGFGLFALQHFAQVPGVRPVAMSGTHREAAMAAARRFGLTMFDEVADMVHSPEVDLVYIATPPFLHHEQAMVALAAGKHVICEKPLAVTLDEADEMMALAHERNLLLVANLMQRYNPLAEAVQSLIEGRLLGDVLHGYFENYAADESLPPEHWFWDRAKSGGIFIEHGVHFFDLFAGWLGGGDVLAAEVVTRPGTQIEDQVHCTARYGTAGRGEGVPVSFYHGFHQPARLDRQELRLVFERGDLTLYDWIPSRYRLHALADEATTRALCELFPDARLDVAAVYGPKDRHCRGRHKEIDAWQMIDLVGGHDRPKMPRYGDLLRALLADQIAWIADRSHPRRITDQNGRDSLAMAMAADCLARS